MMMAVECRTLYGTRQAAARANAVFELFFYSPSEVEKKLKVNTQSNERTNAASLLARCLTEQTFPPVTFAKVNRDEFLA